MGKKILIFVVAILLLAGLGAGGWYVLYSKRVAPKQATVPLDSTLIPSPTPYLFKLTSSSDHPHIAFASDDLVDFLTYFNQIMQGTSGTLAGTPIFSIKEIHFALTTTPQANALPFLRGQSQDATYSNDFNAARGVFTLNVQIDESALLAIVWNNPYSNDLMLKINDAFIQALYWSAHAPATTPGEAQLQDTSTQILHDNLYGSQVRFLTLTRLDHSYTVKPVSTPTPTPVISPSPSPKI